jgi:DNA transposition AAA+ family ATPase
LRRQRCTGKQIARELGVSTATISGIQQRLGLYKLKNFWNRARLCAATNVSPWQDNPS